MAGVRTVPSRLLCLRARPNTDGQRVPLKYEMHESTLNPASRPLYKPTPPKGSRSSGLGFALQPAIANTLGRIAERIFFALAVRLGWLCVGFEPGFETIL